MPRKTNHNKGKKVSSQKIINALKRTAEEIFTLEEFKNLLNSGRQFRIKYGVDVTAPTLHIGHAVNLWMMRKLQDLGHKVIFLVGDYTTRIGDPTGRNKTRPVIPQEEIKKNTRKFINQAKMVLRFDDPNLLELRRNSEWFDKMSTKDFLNLLSIITHARLIARDMFKKRIKNRQDIYMHELIYPILQGYDSYVLKSDLTIIGTDQLFNEILGRFYQEKFGQDPQVIITTKITPGIDGGEKQSKSLGNYIGLEHSPQDKFGRTMSIPDNCIIEYFEVYTELSTKIINRYEKELSGGRNPRELKLKLAFEIVKIYHGEEEAKKAKKEFEKVFSKKEIPEDMPCFEVKNDPVKLVDLLFNLNLTKSKSDARRLIKQGAVDIDGAAIFDIDEVLTPHKGMIIKVGKRKWAKII